jgi:predicted methyltransferase
MTEGIFQALVGGAVLGILAAAMIFFIRVARLAKDKVVENKEQIIDATAKAVTTAGGVAANAYHSMAKRLSDDDSSMDEKYFEAAYEEFKNGDIRQSLWIKELTLANQDEVLAEANYIKVRAREIRDSP